MCFSLPWIEALILQLIVIFGIVALIRLWLPALLGLLGAPVGGLIAGTIQIILWVIVGIFVVRVAFGLLSCLGGVHLGW